MRSQVVSSSSWFAERGFPFIAIVRVPEIHKDEFWLACQTEDHAKAVICAFEFFASHANLLRGDDAPNS